MLPCGDGPVLLRLCTSKNPNASEKRYQPSGKKGREWRAQRNNARAPPNRVTQISQRRVTDESSPENPADRSRSDKSRLSRDLDRVQGRPSRPGYRPIDNREAWVEARDRAAKRPRPGYGRRQDPGPADRGRL